MTFRLYILQRATALVMTPLLIAHLVLIFYATRRGISAADILARTRGSLLAGSAYGVFAMAAAIHGAIGLRGIAAEWGGVRGRRLDLLMWGSGLLLALLGGRAVAAVVLP